MGWIGASERTSASRRPGGCASGVVGSRLEPSGHWTSGRTRLEGRNVRLDQLERRGVWGHEQRHGTGSGLRAARAERIGRTSGAVVPTKLCLESGCGLPVARYGRCSSHALERDRLSHPRNGFYGTRRWRATRKRQLYVEPLCRFCGDVATDVDHIRDIEAGGDVWSSSNLQSLCHRCHSRKTRATQLGVTLEPDDRLERPGRVPSQ